MQLGVHIFAGDGNLDIYPGITHTPNVWVNALECEKSLHRWTNVKWFCTVSYLGENSQRLRWVSQVSKTPWESNPGDGFPQGQWLHFLSKDVFVLEKDLAKEDPLSWSIFSFGPSTHHPIILITALQPQRQAWWISFWKTVQCAGENIHFRQTIEEAQVGPWLLCWCYTRAYASGAWQPQFSGCTEQQTTLWGYPSPVLVQKHKLENIT